MLCPKCESQQVVKNGKATLQDGAVVQKYVCKACRKQFNDRLHPDGATANLLNDCDIGNECPH
ncbi:hypothetical protein O77CONTIG1_04751 [Leptolyngbya sp. O-77]|nr:hypothetical protein O77CONTIG1_04751 [Leptolyngbya sp. O-77]